MPQPTTPEDRQLRLRVAISDMVSRHAESVHLATVAAMTDRDRDAQRHNRAARRRYRAILRLTRTLAGTS